MKLNEAQTQKGGTDNPEAPTPWSRRIEIRHILNDEISQAEGGQTGHLESHLLARRQSKRLSFDGIKTGSGVNQDFTLTVA